MTLRTFPPSNDNTVKMVSSHYAHRLIQPSTSEIIYQEFPTQMHVSGCDDLIADKIYTENFKLVLNQRIEDIYDEIMKMPSYSRES
jgi:hypothetical protein